MEDSDIIEGFWKRDENAIGAMNEKYQSFCYSVAWKILLNREDSEECVNDTWLAAWKYIPPQKPQRLAAFLGKITRGLAIDVLRKKYAAKRTDMHISDISYEVRDLNSIVVYNFEENIEENELRELLNKFLGSLSRKDRDIFVHRYWMMEPLKEIARRHQMTEGAIKQNLLRNRRKLQKILEKEKRL